MFGIAASPAMAAGTLAGTSIDNTATASYDGPGGNRVDVPSNTVSVVVDELLDVVVDSANPGDVAAQPGDAAQVLKYTITNSGNGPEAFSLVANPAVTGDDFDPTLVQIVIDSNGNGAYDPGVDTAYVAGSNDPLLNPDSSVTVFVINGIPATATDGQRAAVELAATAKTGSGAPGTSFDGAGEGGGDAVVGSTGADGSDSGFYVISAASVALNKTATIVDPFGGSQPVPGAVITYTLTATVTGSGSATNLAITDAVPSGTTYIASSITLGGNAQTDAADADAANITSGTVTVNLGDVAGGQTRVVTFKSRIN